MFFTKRFAEFYPEELFIHGFPSVRVKYAGHYFQEDEDDDDNFQQKFSQQRKYPPRRGPVRDEHNRNRTRNRTLNKKKYPSGLTIEEVLPEKNGKITDIEEIIVTPGDTSSVDILSEDVLRNLQEVEVCPEQSSWPQTPLHKGESVEEFEELGEELVGAKMVSKVSAGKSIGESMGNDFKNWRNLGNSGKNTRQFSSMGLGGYGASTNFDNYDNSDGLDNDPMFTPINLNLQ